jgi:hypothetical protein
MKNQSLPTSDSIHNISQMYGDRFLRKVELFPHVNIVLTTAFQLEMLKLHSTDIFVDGTFELVEQNLITLTVAVKHNGSIMPVAWILHSSKETESYENSFRALSYQTGYSLSPERVWADFEEALRKGVSAVFPHAEVLGDSFHFLNANDRKLRSLGGSKVCIILEDYDYTYYNIYDFIECLQFAIGFESSLGFSRYHSIQNQFT